jgi:hypothetical protein
MSIDNGARAAKDGNISLVYAIVGANVQYMDNSSGPLAAEDGTEKSCREKT